jgi:hypothetical protein
MDIDTIPAKPSLPDMTRSKKFAMTKHQPRVLPYMTSSLCPDCLYDDKRVNVIEAEVFEENNQVMMKKTCIKHGEYIEIYWSDADMFRRVMKYWYKTIGLDNPRTSSSKGCPYDCGQCPQHYAHTALGLIDVTSRCNMKCPICFADSEDSETFYEPAPEQVFEMLENLRRNLPVATPGIQFAGGEPTLSDYLPRYVRWAQELGFRHIMIATNGIKMARSVNYVRELVEAGLKTIYLQFDGVTKEPYIEARNVDLRQIKDEVLINCKEAGLDGVILVPTIVRGLNDTELGDIIRYALKNRDIVRCINFQPVSFTGRIDHNKQQKMRITIPDAIHLIERQTDGKIKSDDWYPVSSMMGVGRVLGLMRGLPMFELHAHPACGMATFLFIEDDGSYYPITQVVDLEALLEILEEICDYYAEERRFAGLRSKLKLAGFLKHIRKKNFMKPIISSFLRSGTYSSLRAFMNKVIMLGMMHFQDAFNIDLERVQHCGINYATPDGRIIPFCTYNTIHRSEVEGTFRKGKTQDGVR